jgi:hypothetical protein
LTTLGGSLFRPSPARGFGNPPATRRRQNTLSSATLNGSSASRTTTLAGPPDIAQRSERRIDSLPLLLKLVNDGVYVVH